MKKTFRYRKHLMKMESVFTFGSIVFLIGAFILFLAIPGEDGMFAALFCLFFAVYLFLFTRFFKRFASTEITIDDMGIEFRNNAKEFIIRYEDIKEVNTRAVKNMGGYFVIVKNNKEKIRITVVLENIHEFVKLLKEKLEERELHIYDAEKLYKFYVLSYYSDTSWARVYKNFWKLSLSFGLIIGMYFASAFLADTDQQFEMASNIFAGSVVVFLIVFLYQELGVFAKRINKEAIEDTWSLPSVDIDATAKSQILPVIGISIVTSLAMLVLILL